jgi:hypothetical protein
LAGRQVARSDRRTTRTSPGERLTENRNGC